MSARGRGMRTLRDGDASMVRSLELPYQAHRVVILDQRIRIDGHHVIGRGDAEVGMTRIAIDQQRSRGSVLDAQAAADERDVAVKVARLVWDGRQVEEALALETGPPHRKQRGEPPVLA